MAALLLCVCLVCGVLAGLAAAAGGLALEGRALLGVEPATAETLLVVLPAAGLMPMALLVAAAQSRPALLRRLPAGLGLWLVTAAVVTAWFGLRPLLR